VQSERLSQAYKWQKWSMLRKEYPHSIYSNYSRLQEPVHSSLLAPLLLKLPSIFTDTTICQPRSHLSIRAFYQNDQLPAHLFMAPQNLIKLNTYWANAVAPMCLNHGSLRPIPVFHQCQCCWTIIYWKDKFDTSAIVHGSRHTSGADMCAMEVV
jgi:hypothetical protein